ncbi:hypothetical protein CR513_47005, partial [Mucuna pruriens]
MDKNQFANDNYSGDIMWSNSTYNCCVYPQMQYMSLTKIVKEDKWLQNLIDNLRLDEHKPILYYDSQNVLYLSKNTIYHERSKHIYINYSPVEKIVTIDNSTNMLTKPLSNDKFKHNLDLMNVYIV